MLGHKSRCAFNHLALNEVRGNDLIPVAIIKDRAVPQAGVGMLNRTSRAKMCLHPGRALRA